MVCLFDKVCDDQVWFRGVEADTYVAKEIRVMLTLSTNIFFHAGLLVICGTYITEEWCNYVPAS
jgi:hypothetical protein